MNKREMKVWKSAFFEPSNSRENTKVRAINALNLALLSLIREAFEEEWGVLAHFVIRIDLLQDILGFQYVTKICFDDKIFIVEQEKKYQKLVEFFAFEHIILLVIALLVITSMIIGKL
jgi:hypothetical protein